MKFKSIAAACLVLLSTSAAIAAPEAPEKCPSVSAIQSIGVNTARQFQSLWVGVQASNRFDTQENWIFGIITDAKTAEEAITLGNEALGTLEVIGKPEKSDILPAWGCVYQSDQAIGVAITPPDVIPPNMLARYLSRR